MAFPNRGNTFAQLSNHCKNIHFELINTTMKKHLIYSVGLLFLYPFLSFSQTTYYSQFSGSWGDANMWNTAPDGTGTTRVEATSSPWGDSGIDFVIQTDHELTLNGRTLVNSLEIEENAQLSRGNGVLTYIEIYGTQAQIDGQIGEGDESDGIAMEIVGESIEILGEGSVDLQRLRKAGGADVQLLISTDINLWYGGTGLYSLGTGNNIFDVTIAEGVSVKVLGREDEPGNVSIDGPFGVSGAPRFNSGTFTINGSLEISGNLYLSTNNNIDQDIAYQINGVLELGGQIIGADDAPGEGNASLIVGEGGELILEGEEEVFESLDPERNEIILEEGAIITYAGSEEQQIYDGMDYQTLVLSGGGDKVLDGDIRVEEKLELISGDIRTGEEFTLILLSSDPDAVEGGDEDSYVVGNFRRNVRGDESYFFPIGEEGDVDGYNPFTLNVGIGLLGTEAVTGSYVTEMELLDLEQECDSPEGTRRLSYSCAAGSWEITSNPFAYDISLFPSDATINACPGDAEFSTIRKQEGMEVELGCQEGITGIPFSSFSEFSVVFVSAVAVLPVELLAFEVQAVGSDAKLEWITATETNNSHFEIERSKDGEVFEHIATVTGAGSTQNPQFYEYVDETAQSGRWYYRIKQVDFNGDFDYFHIREVSLRAILEAKMLASYPNPVEDRLHMEFVLPPSEMTTLSITNLQGYRVYQARMTHVQEGYNACDLDLSSLQSGVYIYQIESGTQSIQGKLLKR